MPSELLKLVKKCTGAVEDSDDVAIPAGFVDIGVKNAPAFEKVFVLMKLQTIWLILSQEFATGDS